MPRRALRPCGEPGCPALVASGRCPAHQRERPKDPAQQKFYGSSRWQKLRALVKQQQPFCAGCQREMSATVDHINGDWNDNRRENLQGLCWPCHNAKSGGQHRRRGSGTG